MATKTNEYIQKAKDEGVLVPRLSLAEKITDDYGKLKGTRSTGKHKVKFISDKVIKGKDFNTGNERHEMEYIFEENGNNYSYSKPLRDDNGKVYYFIQKMDEFNYGDTLILEYVPKGLNGYIDIKKVDGEQEETTDEPASDDIPIIEEDVMDQDNLLL